MNTGLSLIFRLLLLIVSVCTAVFFLRKIRKAKVQIHDVVFWLIFSIVLIILSVFPGIIGFFSRFLGIQSPVNFLFLIIIFLLLIHQFSLTLRVSMLEEKLNHLGRTYALDRANYKEKD